MSSNSKKKKKYLLEIDGYRFVQLRYAHQRIGLIQFNLFKATIHSDDMEIAFDMWLLIAE